MSLKLLAQKFRVFRNMLIHRPILAVFDVIKLSNSGIGYVFLQGGDPLIRKDIIQIADIFLLNGIKPTIITNGILLTRPHAEQIASRECNLAISIDSMIHER